MRKIILNDLAFLRIEVVNAVCGSLISRTIYKFSAEFNANKNQVDFDFHYNAFHNNSSHTNLLDRESNGRSIVTIMGVWGLGGGPNRFGSVLARDENINKKIHRNKSK